MKRFIIAGNWKMNIPPSLDEYRAVLKNPAPERVTAVICPPAPFIPYVADFPDFISVGAQDVSEHDSGSYTGETSAAMLSVFGVKYAIVGHSERRASHFEVDELVNRKTKAALRAGLSPIVCVGETLAEREAGRTVEVVTRQIGAVFGSLSDAERESCVAAYEPIWAIGTGLAAAPEDADAMCAEISKIARCPVLYGGSVSLANAESILSQAHIDGALIGGASLDADAFSRIIAIAAELSA
ncbi:MAG: triose-phosphate isomerase [Oscillospiraceae bacterium]|jgi:triosephosphate isomerase|nr:triose-phosphate isomerase [Oscillospiraceae bacterium]